MYPYKRFSSKLHISFVVAVVLLSFVPGVRAQHGALTVQMNLTQMVDESENVVLGRVTSVTAEPHPRYPNLETVVVTVEVAEALKGAPGRQLTFRQYAFDLTDFESKLGYQVGQEVVLMLRRPSQAGLTSPVGLEQGRFRVESDANNNRVVRNGMDNAGLFKGAEQAAPGLRTRLAAQAQRLLTEHQAGPVSYDQFKAFVQSVLATRQGR